MDHRARGLFERGVDEQLLARVQRHRSAVPAAGEQVQPGEAAGEGAARPVENLEDRAVLDQAASLEHGEVPAQGQDRKSTRLNSSHVAISYAVFCLKKN